MESDRGEEQQSQHLEWKQETNSGGGLTRYRSAPSSYLSSLCEPPPPLPRPLSPETESILARFIENVADTSPDPHSLYHIPENSPFIDSVKHETDQMNYAQNSNSIGTNFRVPNSGGTKTNSNLMRHRSSPAGLFDDIIVQDGFLVSKEMTNYGSGSRTNTSSQINFTSDGARRFNNGDDDSLMKGFPWEDSATLSSSGSDFNSSENQKGEERMRRAGGLLSHHLSLPKSSIEKLLQFQDSSVPCKLRAKRGFATHPRSIAERVRRTKISERMRKLQDLVPNMDKQTNTSDMLDLAVDYIKELQKQVTGSRPEEIRRRCLTELDDEDGDGARRLTRFSEPTMSFTGAASFLQI